MFAGRAALPKPDPGVIKPTYTRVWSPMPSRRYGLTRARSWARFASPRVQDVRVDVRPRRERIRLAHGPQAREAAAGVAGHHRRRCSDPSTHFDSRGATVASCSNYGGVRSYFPLEHLVFSEALAARKFPPRLGGEEGFKDDLITLIVLLIVLIAGTTARFRHLRSSLGLRRSYRLLLLLRPLLTASGSQPRRCRLTGRTHARERGREGSPARLVTSSLQLEPKGVEHAQAVLAWRR